MAGSKKFSVALSQLSLASTILCFTLWLIMSHYLKLDCRIHALTFICFPKLFECTVLKGPHTQKVRVVSISLVELFLP